MRGARARLQGLELLEERRLMAIAGAATAGSEESAIVSDLYTDVLQRAGSAGEVEFWLNSIDHGVVTVRGVAKNFFFSGENRAMTVDETYQHFLMRAPEADGRNFWTNALVNGARQTEFQQALLGSDEYYALQGGTDAGFVDGLYTDVLGRASEVDGLTFWTSQIAAGVSRATVASSFVNSVEFRAELIDNAYMQYFGRSVDAPGLAFWQGQLAAGVATETLEVSLLTSFENIPFADLQVGGLSALDVQQILQRASEASSSQDAVIVIVDRGGAILGVRAEQGVLNQFNTPESLAFAIDGALSKARTAAFFANDAGPLTSRTIRFISQSTVTEREVESNPNVQDPNSTIRGPGFVAPIGLGGHFPPDVPNTPPVDLFAIEHTNRDSMTHPGEDHIKGTADDIPLAARFNIDPAFVPAGQEIHAPESYGVVSGMNPDGQNRGIATLPGGVPIYKNGKLVGGIGVFFPGPDGYATHEQGFVPGVGQSTYDRNNAPRVLEAEFIALAAVSTNELLFSKGLASFPMTATPAGVNLLANGGGRIDLVGIQLEIYGPHPTANFPVEGIQRLQLVGNAVGRGFSSGADQVIDPNIPRLYDGSRAVPEGWLVTPHDSPIGGLTAAEVEQMILNGVNTANQVRAAIRLNGDLTPGARTRMILSVTDTDGNVLGLFRMPDATFFSIDVAVAKARNVSYYADASALQLVDRIDPLTGNPDLPAGVAFSNRTFRFLAEPRFPSGVDGAPPAPFSILFDPGSQLVFQNGIPVNTENVNQFAPAMASQFQSVLGYDAFNPGTNFRDQNNYGGDPDLIANQNGIVFFPGSAPIYKNGVLVGGLGVSGDGVDQDDVVTIASATGFEPVGVPRADDIFLRNVRLPYQKSLRNPFGI